MNSSKITNQTHVGGIEFFLENLAAYLPYTTISALATVFGK